MGRRRAYIILLLTALLVLAGESAHAQLSNKERKKLRKAPVTSTEQPQRYRVESGIRHVVDKVPEAMETAIDDRTRDSLRFAGAADAADSLAVVRTILRNDSALFAHGYMPEDSLLLAGAATAADSLTIHDRIRDDYLSVLAAQKEIERDSIKTTGAAATVDMATVMSKRQQLRWERTNDTTRYNRFFRDSLPISRMCWISAIAPGFGQFYNEQYWKIPIAYAALGTTVTLGLWQNRIFQSYKSEYDALIYEGASREGSNLDEVQSLMIRHNTWRQMAIIGAVASYIYFIGDGAIHYKGALTSVKKATTLSTICPGAGQFYNRSYWKVPIVMGGFASMFYIIDWNNRGYQRFKLAYDIVTTTPPGEEFKDEFRGSLSPEVLRNWRNQYRRARDLGIILTGALFLFNIVDAHVDAQLKDYDISDDLAITVEPTVVNFYSMQRSVRNLPGLSLKVRF